MNRPAFSPEGVTLGVCLVALGVLWTLSNLGRVEILPVRPHLVAALPRPLGRPRAGGAVHPPLLREVLR